MIHWRVVPYRRVTGAGAKQSTHSLFTIKS